MVWGFTERLIHLECVDQPLCAGHKRAGGMGNSRQGEHQRPRTLKGAGICMECDREGPPGRMRGDVILASETWLVKGFKVTPECCVGKEEPSAEK